VPRALKDLRDFARVALQPGETKTVRMSLPASSLAFWDADTERWVVEREPVELQVGGSSADVRLTTTVQVAGAH
jgi:beta-glucosidase